MYRLQSILIYDSKIFKVLQTRLFSFYIISIYSVDFFILKWQLASGDKTSLRVGLFINVSNTIANKNAISVIIFVFFCLHTFMRNLEICYFPATERDFAEQRMIKYTLNIS